MNILECLGTGTVTATKTEDSNLIWFYSPLLHPTAEGGASLDVNRNKQETVNEQGKTVVNDVMVTNKQYPATWAAIGEPNRLTPPDVREGTEIAIYQVKGSNEYLWTTWGFSAKTMRLEHIVYGWSGVPDLDAKAPFNLANYYTLVISTRDGSVVFRNSVKNGEKGVMEVALNFKMTRAQLTGSNGGVFVFDDFEENLIYSNRYGTTVTASKKDIYMFSPDKMMVEAVNSISLVCKQLVVQADIGQLNFTNALQINTPNATFSGNTTIDGKVEGKGGVKSGKNDMDGHYHIDAEGRPTQKAIT